jgi:hypothetical protein
MTIPTLFSISEFPDPSDGTLNAPNAVGWVRDQSLTVSTSSSVASNPFKENTRLVILSANVACWVAWTMPGQTTSNATASSLFLPANSPIQFAVLGGMIVSALQVPTS